jgi:hypothetical protein
MSSTTVSTAGIRRELARQRLADERAEEQALATLKAAAARAREQGGAAASVLAACAAFDAPEFESPDARELRGAAVTAAPFLDLLPDWIAELRQIASVHPTTGACTIATAMQLWLWTVNHMKGNGHAAITAPELADAFGPLLAARTRVLEIAGQSTPDALSDDLCHVYAAHAAASAGALCAEIVFGYRRHLSWDPEGCATCYGADELDDLECIMPGIASSARAYADVIEVDGGHAAKAGPCARFDGVETFLRLRARLDGCLTGARRAKDRAAAALLS